MYSPAVFMQYLWYVPFAIAFDIHELRQHFVVQVTEIYVGVKKFVAHAFCVFLWALHRTANLVCAGDAFLVMVTTLGEVCYDPVVCQLLEGILISCAKY